jgi:hypothetical protein
VIETDSGGGDDVSDLGYGGNTETVRYSSNRKVVLFYGFVICVLCYVK